MEPENKPPYKLVIRIFDPEFNLFLNQVRIKTLEEKIDECNELLLENELEILEPLTFNQKRSLEESRRIFIQLQKQIKAKLIPELN